MPADFNPEMLVVARESRGYSQTEFARSARIPQGTLSKIESGLMSPSDDLVLKFSELLDYTVEFFRQTERIYGFNSSVYFHRKRQRLSERVLSRLHEKINLTRIRIAQLLRSIEMPSCKFQRIDPADYDGRADLVARIVKSTWLIPMGAFRNVTRSIEDAGGVVVHFDFGTRHADAISEWVPGYPPIFLVNSNADITGDRLRLTLAHEIGHIVMHKFASPRMEEEANGFASEFVMPRKEIKPALYRLNIPKLIELKSEWNVSMAALIQRAYELKTITEAQRRYMFINMSRNGWRLREPAETDVPIERPELFPRLLQTHLGELGYSLRELSTLMFVRNENEFRETYLAPKGLRLVG
jgi:Zn-dependent peptidase ImmA (M78 family)/transcriptional regulator with XRE-family HTH domain